MNRRRSLTVVLIAVALGFVPVPGAETPDSPPADDGIDPVVRDVARMLEKGVEPAVVLQWLESSDARPGPLSPDDLILLSKVSAPEELVSRLIELSEQPAKTLEAPAPEPAAAAGAPEAGACCLVEIDIDYHPVEALEGDQRLPSIDMFVYLDGRFLARLKDPGDIAPKKGFARELRLAPGMHTIRLSREEHVPKKRKSVWHHETRVSPDVIRFELAPSASWRLEVRWKEVVFTTGQRGPLTWQLLRDGVQVAGVRRVGADKDGWPLLCEDIEANRDAGLISDKAARKKLELCVRWSDLWPAEADVPSRAEILGEMELYDYEPVVTSLGGPSDPAPARPGGGH